MPRITNPVYTDREKRFLEFVLNHDFPERDQVVEQLNRMRESELTRDVTPWYWILEFRPGGANPGHGPMRPYLYIEVLHEHGAVPSEFTLYKRGGLPFELEIYNADSSVMDLDAILEGRTVVSFPE